MSKRLAKSGLTGYVELQRSGIQNQHCRFLPASSSCIPKPKSLIFVAYSRAVQRPQLFAVRLGIAVHNASTVRAAFCVRTSEWFSIFSLLLISFIWPEMLWSFWPATFLIKNKVHPEIAYFKIKNMDIPYFLKTTREYCLERIGYVHEYSLPRIWYHWLSLSEN